MASSEIPTVGTLMLSASDLSETGKLHKIMFDDIWIGTALRLGAFCK